jgi:hypothetical protein
VKRKSLALLAPLLAVLVIFFAVTRSRRAQVTLTFAGFAPDRAATFVLSNRSGQTLACYGPIYHPDPPLAAAEETFKWLVPEEPVVPPRTHQLIWMPPIEAKTWRAEVLYFRAEQFPDKVRSALINAGFPLHGPDFSASVVSDIVTNPQPVP